MNPLYHHIVSVLRDTYGQEEAREMAFWLLESEAGMSRADVLACKDTKKIPNIEIILQRLLKKEPIQYILGRTEWMGLDLEVNSDTLIPRPETAELVEWIEEDTRCRMHNAECTMHDGMVRVLDVGTGSGCIAIALQKRHPEWNVAGMDISQGALEVARRNATRNSVEMEWIKRDVLADGIEGKWDIIVSNPPYICEEEKAGMDTNVLAYEPHSALFVPNDDPLRFYRRIAELKAGRELYFEINERFGHEIAKMLESIGYIDVEIRKDIYGKERMVRGRIAQ